MRDLAPCLVVLLAAGCPGAGPDPVPQDNAPLPSSGLVLGDFMSHKGNIHLIDAVADSGVVLAAVLEVREGETVYNPGPSTCQYGCELGGQTWVTIHASEDRGATWRELDVTVDVPPLGEDSTRELVGLHAAGGRATIVWAVSDAKYRGYMFSDFDPRTGRAITNPQIYEKTLGRPDAAGSRLVSLTWQADGGLESGTWREAAYDVATAQFTEQTIRGTSADHPCAPYRWVTEDGTTFRTLCATREPPIQLCEGEYALGGGRLPVFRCVPWPRQAPQPGAPSVTRGGLWHLASDEYGLYGMRRGSPLAPGPYPAPFVELGEGQLAKWMGSRPLHDPMGLLVPVSRTGSIADWYLDFLPGGRVDRLVFASPCRWRCESLAAWPVWAIPLEEDDYLVFYDYDDYHTGDAGLYAFRQTAARAPNARTPGTEFERQGFDAGRLEYVCLAAKRCLKKSLRDCREHWRSVPFGSPVFEKLKTMRLDDCDAVAEAWPEAVPPADRSCDPACRGNLAIACRSVNGVREAVGAVDCATWGSTCVDGACVVPGQPLRGEFGCLPGGGYETRVDVGGVAVSVHKNCPAFGQTCSTGTASSCAFGALASGCEDGVASAPEGRLDCGWVGGVCTFEPTWPRAQCFVPRTDIENLCGGASTPKCAGPMGILCPPPHDDATRAVYVDCRKVSGGWCAVDYSPQGAELRCL